MSLRAPPVLVLFAVAALGGCSGAGSAPTTHSRPPAAMRGDGIRYLAPAGWNVARRSLTPQLTNPRELLTASTGPLPSGGACAHVPSAALASMSATDVLVTVQERFGSTASFPIRPARFSLPPAERTEAESCAGQHPTFATHLLEFRDGGRGFHVIVAVGHAAPASRVRQALALLDSLRITPRRPARVDPNTAIPYDGPAGLHLVLPVAWRVYRQPLTQAVSERDQLALGTFPLHQQRPDPNCTPRTALRARPRNGGFIYMFEIDGLTRRALAHVPPRPARLRLPSSSHQPYECVGPSWMVRFRDGGRAFQAHIYGPPRRRREALAILDSLRVDPAPFDTRLHAARFPRPPGWHTWVSGPAHEGRCLRQRVSWAATTRFADGPNELPPTRTIERLPPSGIVIAAVQSLDRCRRPYGLRPLRPPLSLRHATRMQFPGPGGNELPLYRLIGRLPGRYKVDVWVFYGRRNPGRAQVATAQRELAQARWPAWL